MYLNRIFLTVLFFGLLTLLPAFHLHSIKDPDKVHTGFVHNPFSISVLEDSIGYMYDKLGLKQMNLSYRAFRYALIGYYNLRQEGKLKNLNVLTVIDFTQSSKCKRIYIIDLTHNKVIYNTYVSHGKNTGEDLPTAFSNTIHSNQSSLGFYVTAETYIGSKGYSLRLDGVEPGVNDNMRKRAVVMHSADYVSEAHIEKYGRLGRSQGCPALPVEVSASIIDQIKGGSAIFAYYNDIHYLMASSYLKRDQFLLTGEAFAAVSAP